MCQLYPESLFSAQVRRNHRALCSLRTFALIPGLPGVIFPIRGLPWKAAQLRFPGNAMRYNESAPNFHP